MLEFSDVREVDGTWVLDINDNGPKRLKNAASRRLIPIHRRLIDLGVLDYVETLRSKSAKRLFPELEKGRDGYSQSASKWFGRYRKNCGINETGKVFYSFRHTFADTLKQKNADPQKIAALMGHADGSITTGRYGKPFEPSALIDTIEMLDFPLDLPTHSW